MHGASLASAASSTNSVAHSASGELAAAARARAAAASEPAARVELVNAAPAAGGDDESDGDDGAPPLDLGKLVVSLATLLLVTFLLVLYLDAARRGHERDARRAQRDDGVHRGRRRRRATIAWGVAENAGAVALWICMVTWLMYCLYKHRCYRVIYGWLVLSVAMLLGGTGGGSRASSSRSTRPARLAERARRRRDANRRQPTAQFSQLRRRRAPPAARAGTFCCGTSRRWARSPSSGRARSSASGRRRPCGWRAATWWWCPRCSAGR